MSRSDDAQLPILSRIYSHAFGFPQLLLLGQAESGKSTLQKQFQLMYKPNSLDQERLSWRTVIYFNVVRSLKHILNTLETWDDVADDVDDPTGTALDDEKPRNHRSNGNAIADQPSPSTSLIDVVDANGAQSSTSHSSGSPSMSASSGAMHIASLRRRLASLVAMDTQLADRLSGGIDVSGSGKGGVYVRSGWQARTIENAIGKMKQKRPNTSEKRARESVSAEIPPDPMVEEVARLLEASQEDIHELWGHPTVKHLIAKRRLKLDEWSEL